MTTTTVEEIVTGTGAAVVPVANIRASVLRDALGTVAVAMGKDATLPILAGAYVSWSHGGSVAFAGTDRYRLVALDTTGEDDTTATGEAVFILHRNDVTELIKALPKAGKRYIPQDRQARVLITVTGSHVTFAYSDGDRSWSRECRIVEGTFPSYRTLIPSDETLAASEGVTGIGWNPAYMADFAKMPIVDKTIFFRFTHPSKPMVAALEGDGLVGSALLMPVRLTS